MPQDLIATLRATDEEISPLYRRDAADALEAQAAEIARLKAERDAFKQSLYAELDTNLRLRELGGAQPDEPMTPFLERVIAERDGLRVDAERLSRLPRLPTPRVLASGSTAGKRVELHGWHTDDIEIWERQHGIKFGAAREST